MAHFLKVKRMRRSISEYEKTELPQVLIFFSDMKLGFSHGIGTVGRRFWNFDCWEGSSRVLGAIFNAKRKPGK